MPGFVGSKTAKNDFCCPYRYDPSDGTQLCLGEDCMAWRWKNMDPDDPQELVGYCGLADKPKRDD